jgi:magnesium transporter
MLSRTTIPGLRTRVSDEDEILPHDAMQRRLHEVRTLLDRQRRVESLLHRQEMPRHELVETLVAKQHHSELTKKLDAMHPADIAYILEALPPEDRLLVWDLVRAERDGEILLEVSDAVRESLIDAMEPKELVAAVEQLDADELADLAPDLPIEVMQDVFSALDVEEREQLRAAMSYPEDSVGALMDFDMVTVREDVTLEVVLRYLRRSTNCPTTPTRLFVSTAKRRCAVRCRSTRCWSTTWMSRWQRDARASAGAACVGRRRSAAQAFERYDLVSAPVIDHHDRLIGRLTVNEVMDFIREDRKSNCWRRPACVRRKTSSRPSWIRCATAGPGWRSTCAPPSSPRA